MPAAMLDTEDPAVERSDIVFPHLELTVYGVYDLPYLSSGYILIIS